MAPRFLKRLRNAGQDRERKINEDKNRTITFPKTNDVHFAGQHLETWKHEETLPSSFRRLRNAGQHREAIQFSKIHQHRATKIPHDQ